MMSKREEAMGLTPEQFNRLYPREMILKRRAKSSTDRNKTVVITKSGREWDVDFYYGAEQGSPIFVRSYGTKKEAIGKAKKWLKHNKLTKVI